MSKEVDTYKIFRQLEAREKRANPYKFYDKDELIDEILKNEEEIERLNNIINELEKYCNEEIEDYDKAISSKILSEIGRDKYEAEKMCFLDMLDKLQELKGEDKE